jgi:hypothetical protein
MPTRVSIRSAPYTVTTFEWVTRAIIWPSSMTTDSSRSLRRKSFSATRRFSRRS